MCSSSSKRARMGGSGAIGTCRGKSRTGECRIGIGIVSGAPIRTWVNFAPNRAPNMAVTEMAAAAGRSTAPAVEKDRQPGQGLRVFCSLSVHFYHDWEARGEDGKVGERCVRHRAQALLSRAGGAASAGSHAALPVPIARGPRGVSHGQSRT